MNNASAASFGLAGLREVGVIVDSFDSYPVVPLSLRHVEQRPLLLAKPNYRPSVTGRYIYCRFL
ncbi:hypothetical protein HOE425_150017 [Hoeflea sp. EC-HK425]|nr:hypothetical protein HOE425_150017 [Hoeflea sp. EC-HK425]